MDSTPEDHAAIRSVLSKVDFYPLSSFDGKVKVKDWSRFPSYPAAKSAGGSEIKWVNPQTFFEQLPAVMKQVPPLPGEEALCRLIDSVMAAANKDPALKQSLTSVAVAAKSELISPLFQSRNVGVPVGNGWNSQTIAAKWGTDYLNRAAMAESSMHGNQPEVTRYLSADDGSLGAQLDGHHAYAITCPGGGMPPVHGFWSITLYNQFHMFEPNALNRYSLGTKDKKLHYNADGPVTLYVVASSPGKDKEDNWLRTPNRSFALLMRAYWPDEAILGGTWLPLKVEKVT